MVNLERAIYTISYFWHGITKRGVHSIAWLFDSLHNLELLSWSTVNGLPYNQGVADKIDEMIANNDLRITNRWKTKFANSGLEPIQTPNSPKLYKPSERFSENFRSSVHYYIENKKEFKQLYNLYENTPLNKNKFYEYVLNKLQENARLQA